MRTKPPLATFQASFELDRMLALFVEKRPARVLEIGCWDGGTLWHWLQLAKVAVVIDDLMRRAEDWRRWAAEAGAKLHLLKGFSQEPEIVECAAALGPYDFMLVDGDHSYGAVKADWENYRPMMAQGGLMLFHDILPRPGYGVDRVWSEIKAAAGSRYMEVVQNAVEPGNEGLCGLGVVWL